jgi:Tol biopolymer transport system component
MCSAHRVRRAGWAALVVALAVALPLTATAGGSSAAAGRRGNGLISFTGVNGTIYEVSPRGTLPHALAVCATDGDFRWSPGGRQVAFWRERDEIGCGPETNNVYVVDANGAGLVPLGPGDSWFPAWSPDGSEIAFIHCEAETVSSERCAVFEVQPNGTELHRVGPWGPSREFSGPVGEPVWSPDGSEIAFPYCETVTESSRHCAVFEIEASGTVLQRLTPWGIEGEPIWSPNGEKLAVESDNSPLALYVVSADGSDLRRVAVLPGSLGFPGVPIFAGKPVWSPNSQEIAFVRGSDIYVARDNGAGLRRLTQGEYPAWSPDGERIAFLDFRPRRSTCESIYAIFTVAANDSDRRRLTPEALYAGPPVWSPDGKLIAYPADYDSGGKTQCRREKARGGLPPLEVGYPVTFYERLYVVPAAGGPPRRLTDAAPGPDLVWEPASAAAR